MPDVYATITEADREYVKGLVVHQERRAAIPRQIAMREAYFSHIPFPKNSRVLEIGSGSGAVARALAAWPNVGEVVGLDPSPVFVECARELGVSTKNLSFAEGDGAAIPFEN